MFLKPNSLRFKYLAQRLVMCIGSSLDEFVVANRKITREEAETLLRQLQPPDVQRETHIIVVGSSAMGKTNFESCITQISNSFICNVSDVTCFDRHTYLEPEPLPVEYVAGDLLFLYVSPVKIRMPRVRRRYHIHQPCWSSRRWKSLT